MDDALLLVDDEPGILNFARLVLERAGYHVITANSAKTAVEVFSEHHDAIPVLVTDIRMPEMGGFALAKLLKGKSPELKVIYISGYPALEEAPPGYDEIEATYLSKPFTAKALSDEVEKAYSLKYRR